jgi:hypothetical protein
MSSACLPWATLLQNSSCTIKMGKTELRQLGTPPATSFSHTWLNPQPSEPWPQVSVCRDEGWSACLPGEPHGRESPVPPGQGGDTGSTKSPGASSGTCAVPTHLPAVPEHGSRSQSSMQYNYRGEQMDFVDNTRREREVNVCNPAQGLSALRANFFFFFWLLQAAGL